MCLAFVYSLCRCILGFKFTQSIISFYFFFLCYSSSLNISFLWVSWLICILLHNLLYFLFFSFSSRFSLPFIFSSFWPVFLSKLASSHPLVFPLFLLTVQSLHHLFPYVNLLFLLSYPWLASSLPSLFFFTYLTSPLWHISDPSLFLVLLTVLSPPTFPSLCIVLLSC